MRAASCGTWMVVTLVMVATAARAAPSARDVERAVTRLSDGGEDWQVVETFYAEREFAPAWTTDAAGRARADAVLAALDRADHDGLDPDAYARAELRDLRARRDDAGAALYDALISRALVAYAADLGGARLPPSAFEFEPAPAPAAPPAERLDALRRIAQTDDVEYALGRLAPASADYRRLRRALAQYRALAAAGGWPAVPDGPTLKPGMSDPRVPILRRRLQVTGDITSQDPNSFAYDAGLELAVRGFQARHGLEVDGVVGPASRAALNLPVGERIAQLLINLERWRWLPDDLGDRFVVVNIAGFELQAIDDGQTVFRSAVVVGTPYHQTPVFSDQIEYVEFNPFWNVPTSIARNEILPKARRDPGYLAQQNIRVLAGWGDDAPAVDPRRIDWSRPVPYRLRQEPGPNNALGRVKIMFPNPFNVYLHDTPARDLFGRASRAFSHGCIRVHEPLALAAHVLGWSLPQAQRAVDAGSRRIVRLAEPLPAHITYQTAWVGQDGAVQFRDDIYGRDARVADLLFRPS